MKHSLEFSIITLSCIETLNGNLNFHFYRVLLHNELELTSSKASLDYMKAAMAELTISRNERQRAKEMLLMKHKKIEDFEKLAVRNLLL